MKIRALSVAAAAGMLLAGGLSATGAEATSSAKAYKNCTELNKKYPHGVGKKGARDLISKKYVAGKSVTTFKVGNDLYQANKKSDRDGDGVACEKR